MQRFKHQLVEIRGFVGRAEVGVGRRADSSPVEERLAELHGRPCGDRKPEHQRCPGTGIGVVLKPGKGKGDAKGVKAGEHLQTGECFSFHPGDATVSKVQRGRSRIGHRIATKHRAAVADDVLVLELTGAHRRHSRNSSSMLIWCSFEFTIEPRTAARSKVASTEKPDFRCPHILRQKTVVQAQLNL